MVGLSPVLERGVGGLGVDLAAEVLEFLSQCTLELEALGNLEGLGVDVLKR